MPRDPQHDVEPVVPSEAELRRKIRELGKKLGIKEAPPAPGTGNELWPGGPSVDTNDIRIAGRRTRRPPSGVA